MDKKRLFYEAPLAQCVKLSQECAVMLISTYKGGYDEWIVAKKLL